MLCLAAGAIFRDGAHDMTIKSVSEKIHEYINSRKDKTATHSQVCAAFNDPTGKNVSTAIAKMVKDNRLGKGYRKGDCIYTTSMRRSDDFGDIDHQILQVIDSHGGKIERAEIPRKLRTNPCNCYGAIDLMIADRILMASRWCVERYREEEKEEAPIVGRPRVVRLTDTRRNSKGTNPWIEYTNSRPGGSAC